MSQYNISTQQEQTGISEDPRATIMEKYEALERLAGILKDENRDLKRMMRKTGNAQKCVGVSELRPSPDDERFLHRQAGVEDGLVGSDGPALRPMRRSDYAFIRTPHYRDAKHLKRRPKAISVKIVDAQEQERKRISRDLHDGVCQSLVGLRMLLETILDESEKENAIYEMVRQALDTARKTENDVRSIMDQLQPPNLKEHGLKSTIEQTITTFKLSHSLTEFRSEITTDEHDIPERLQVVIYRVIQEAINNIRKHSGAPSAKITLRRIGDMLRLTIEDNGAGFDQQTVFNSGSPLQGMGLMSMRDRVQASGGTFLFDTRIGVGTRIVCEWDSDWLDSQTD